jgi:hypothetical protein
LTSIAAAATRSSSKALLEQQQQSSSIGRDLDASQRAALSDEQRDSLRQLDDAATCETLK